MIVGGDSKHMILCQVFLFPYLFKPRTEVGLILYFVDSPKSSLTILRCAIFVLDKCAETLCGSTTGDMCNTTHPLCKQQPTNVNIEPNAKVIPTHVLLHALGDTHVPTNEHY